MFSNPILLIGLILFFGFLFGEIAKAVKLPKITGYIVAGILLDPDLTGIIPANFIDHTDPVTNLSLAVIAFSIGGSLLFKKIKELGKGIISITFFEAQLAFIATSLGFVLFSPMMLKIPHATLIATYIPFSLLIAALASPTDPTSILAVAHEYKAKGPVSSTVMGVAAFDDVMGIINFSFAIVISQSLMAHIGFSFFSSVLKPMLIIIGSVAIGVLFGVLLNLFNKIVKGDSDGVYLVLIMAFLSLSYGLSDLVGADPLLASMSMGLIVVNFNPNRQKIFQILERYTEEIIFVIFFTLSGMHLNFKVFGSSILLVLIFIVLRNSGKFVGTWLGATISRSSPPVKKYTIGGLIPQGGIVVGLALVIKQHQEFSVIADYIISIIIGATVIHELIGPILSKISLKKAGEIN
ncbi:MAG: cation:proton antiporter [bacterium]